MNLLTSRTAKQKIILYILNLILIKALRSKTPIKIVSLKYISFILRNML